jgi:acetyl-CoA C-acetyltransferase
VKPVSLVVGLLDELRTRNPELNPEQVEDVVLGCVSPIGDQGGDIAKTATIAAGYPDTTGGVQLNRFCASGLEAVNQAGQRVASGWEDMIIGGGVESMSRVPMASDGGPWAMDPETNFKTGFAPQGIGADLIASLEGFTRNDVDSFAVRSQQLAGKAREAGYFKKSVIPVTDLNGMVVLEHDEFIRAETTVEGLSTLKPSFEQMGQMAFDATALRKYTTIEKINHVHHAGNSSGIVDGAALVLIGSGEKGKSLGLKARARIRSVAVIGSEPTIMLTGIAPAAQKALKKAGMTVKDIDLFEINEAFAAVVLKAVRALDIDLAKVNVNGGSIAMGHPLGATGSIILGTVLDELERTNKSTALISLCVGAGMGIATIIERV